MSLFRPRLYLLFFALLGGASLGLHAQNMSLLLQNDMSRTTSPSFGVAPVMAATAEEKEPEKEEKQANDEAPQTHTAPPENAPTLKYRERAEDEREMSRAEMELIKNLANRREQLDKKAKDIEAREALARVAEQRVEQKIKEMEALRAQVQQLLGQASDQQAAQIENLVKIYETMKPKEASRIFETLEMPVLMGVVQKMKPQKIAAVLSELPPEKAKEITVALTRQDRLPQIRE